MPDARWGYPTVNNVKHHIYSQFTSRVIHPHKDNVGVNSLFMFPFSVHQVMVVKKHTHRLTKNTENEPEDHISHLP